MAVIVGMLMAVVMAMLMIVSVTMSVFSVYHMHRIFLLLFQT